MVSEPSGALIIATGGSGKIFRVTGDPATVALVSRAPAQQVTRFLQEPDGRLAFATSNPGKVFRLLAGRAPRGAYLSEVRDAQTIASWGSVRWRANGGGRVEIFTRSGNTATPDDTWSEWEGPYLRSEGEQIRSPKARYLQWRAVLIAADRSDAPPPVLTSVTSAFLPRNLRPAVTAITVHPPGAVFQRPFPTSDQIDVAGLESTPIDGKPGQPPPAQAVTAGAPGAPPLGRRLYQKGLQTLTWTARDDNQDTLQFDVLYRREGDSSWKTLKRGLWDPIIVWDTTSVPDGTYIIKVSALDAPTNAPADALAGEAQSEAFDVDNTAPRIEVSPARAGAALVVGFTVRDDHSAIKRVEYSLDADRWRVLYPRDGIPDSRVEEFELILEGDAAQKGVIVRATDAMNNVATAALPAGR
jgi:hypothetical protein